MENRIVEMDSFLKKLSSIYKQNPNTEIYNKTIYHLLMVYDVDNKDLENNDIQYYYQHWIARFKDKQNLKVFHDIRQKRFLQFRNDIRKDHDNYKFIKLYINLPKDQIFNGVNEIFNYIEKNNYSTYSKVSDVVRADSIVLRMEKENEARDLMNFINIKYKECAHKTNPFLVRNGVVGIGYDDLLSYNDNLSKLIAEYLKFHKKNNTLEEVSLHDFREYVKFMYHSNFKDINGIRNFDMNNRTTNTFDSNSQKILNYEQITQMILKSLNEETTYNEIIESINNYNDSLNNESMLNYYDVILNQKQISYNKVVEIINNYILYASKKYGPNEVYKYLASYAKNNRRAITRDNNFRMLFQTYISPNTLINIIGPNINDYIESIIPNNNVVYK